MKTINDYSNFWERDKFKYVLLSIEGTDVMSIYNWYFHSIVIIDVDFDMAKKIANNMINAGVKVYKSFDDLYKAYPPITSEERRKRMDEYPKLNLN